MPFWKLHKGSGFEGKEIMMKPYEKGKIPQIIWGSKSADRVGAELKSADVQKCLIVKERDAIAPTQNRPSLSPQRKSQSGAEAALLSAPGENP